MRSTSPSSTDISFCTLNTHGPPRSGRYDTSVPAAKHHSRQMSQTLQENIAVPPAVPGALMSEVAAPHAHVLTCHQV